MPALATSTSTGPCASSAAANAASTEAVSVTSQITGSPPAATVGGGSPER